MLEDMDMKGHALNIPSKTNQIDRAPKLVKVNGGSTTPSQVVSVTSHMSAPLQSSGVPGRQTPKNEIADTGKQATQVSNCCMTYLYLLWSCYLFILIESPSSSYFYSKLI